MMTKESKKILRGEFGQTVKPFNKEVQKKAIGDEKPITCRPADLIKPQLDNFRKEAAQYIQQDEDVLTYALFPQVATEFFKYREAQQTKVDRNPSDDYGKYLCNRRCNFNRSSDWNLNFCIYGFLLSQKSISFFKIGN